MTTLFPVQYAQKNAPNRAAKQIIQAIQQSSLTYLIECALLEQWVSERLITVTTTTDYLSKQPLQQPLTMLPRAYQAFFAQDKPLLAIQTGTDSRLLLLVESGYTAPWRLSQPCMPLIYKLATDNTYASLQQVDNAHTLLDILLSVMDQSQLSEAGISKLKESLQASLDAEQWSASADITTTVYQRPHWYQTLIAGEQWASLMDRPFHPLAKGKLGFTKAAYQHYMAEFNQPIALAWVAIARSHLMAADNVTDISTQNPATFLLESAQQQCLDQELEDKNLTDTHVALPVHPWQMSQVIDSMYADDFAAGTVVKLSFNAAVTYASASMRSMLISRDTPHSIKLPLGVYALNSKRYLPALKLINGEKNEAILRQAQQIDPVLSKQMRLWDERLWWGYMSPDHVQDKSSINPYFYQEKPTHLGAMMRSLPADLCDDQVRLLPMASLGMLVYKDGISHHIFDEIIQSKQALAKLEQIKAAAIDCFNTLCEVFLGTMLRCLRLGLAPEMHGQNIVVVLRAHQFTSVLLRDHDSLRIHLPWLDRHHIADPEYLSPPDFKNRLYRETPQTLIFYLQSLGILVNIRAIIESLSEHYKIDEATLWQQVSSCIDDALEHIDFDIDQSKLIREQLLTTSYYPHKTLLLPVIERGADPHGSMPAGESKTCNPFYSINKADKAIDQSHYTNAKRFA